MHITIRNIYKKIREIEVLRISVTANKPRPALIVTKEIEEVVLCLIGLALFVY